MRTVAYYKGCLASLSAKELDTSTQALAPKVGLDLIELESVTCCGAGDIHEAEPDCYLHLNARILTYAEATGTDTLMTDICTLSLRQANHQLLGDDALRERVMNCQLGRGAGHGFPARPRASPHALSAPSLRRGAKKAEPNGRYSSVSDDRGL